jgi:hypothetical protein
MIEKMVGTRRLELLTSTVSSHSGAAPLTTYKVDAESLASRKSFKFVQRQTSSPTNRPDITMPLLDQRRRKSSRG